jgi:hypothetical protein
MSSAAMNWAFEKIVPNLKDQVVKLVVLRLADRADPAGLCWPGHNRTARDLNVSTRSVQLSIKKLTELKLLEIDEKKGKVGLIRLQLQNTVPIESSQNAKKKVKKKTVRTVRGEAISPLTGDASSPHGVKPDHSGGYANSPPGGETVSPESPSVEFLIKPPLETDTESVVVAKRAEENGDMSTIIWPSWIALEMQGACVQTLDQVDIGRRQQLVDELAGAARMKPIVSPPAWLRRLIQLDRAGGLILEHADAAVAARRAHAAAAERLLSIGLPLQPSRSMNQPSQIQIEQQELLKALRLKWRGKPPAEAKSAEPSEPAKMCT